MTDVCEKNTNHPQSTIYFWLTDVYVVIDTKTPAEWPEMATTCAIQNNFIPRGSFQLIFWNKKRLFLHVQIYRHTTQVLSKADSPTGGRSGRWGQVPNSFRKQIFPKGTKKVTVLLLTSL